MADADRCQGIQSAVAQRRIHLTADLRVPQDIVLGLPQCQVAALPSRSPHVLREQRRDSGGDAAPESRRSQFRPRPAICHSRRPDAE